MMNFRLRSEDVPKLDAAAKTAGMSRSDFIRQAITEKVARTMRSVDPEMAPAPGRGPAIKAEKKMPFPDCPRSAQCKLQKLPTGIKLCTSCGIKIA